MDEAERGGHESNGWIGIRERGNLRGCAGASDEQLGAEALALPKQRIKTRLKEGLVAVGCHYDRYRGERSSTRTALHRRNDLAIQPARRAKARR